MKVVATTLGEMLGDYLSMSLTLGYRIIFVITFSVLLFAFYLYSRPSRGYNPFLFWFLIISTTTAGTEISDMLDRTFHLGYVWGSSLLFSGLMAVLGLWFLRYRSLSLRPFEDSAKEYLFWTAVIFSNSLGTAFGDFLTTNMGLDFLGASFLTLGIIGFVALLHFLVKGYDRSIFPNHIYPSAGSWKEN